MDPIARLQKIAEELETRQARLKALQLKENRSTNDELEIAETRIAIRNFEAERDAICKEHDIGNGPRVGLAYMPSDDTRQSPLADGEVRLFAPNERIAPAIRHNLPDGIRPEELHFGRAIRAIVTNDWRDAQAEQRAMSTGLDGWGLPSPMATDWIDRARNISVLNRAGMRTVPMDRNDLTFPRTLTDPTAYWVGENADATESAPTFGAVKLRAKKLIVYVRMSMELFEDSPESAAAVRNASVQAAALEMDRAGLFGVGAGEEPRGLYYDPDLTEISMGTNGGVFGNYNKFLDAIQELEEANGSPSVKIYSPRTKNSLAQLLDGGGDILEVPPDVAALRTLTSNQIPNDLTQGSASNASVAFVGGFENLVMGVRIGGVRVEVSREADGAFKASQVLLKCTMRADYVTTRPSQIARIVGIIPSS